MQLNKMLTTKNVGKMDRIIRLAPAILTVVLYSYGIVTGTLLYVLVVVSAMLALTSVLGSCSIYYFLGFSTCSISGVSKKS